KQLSEFAKDDASLTKLPSTELLHSSDGGGFEPPKPFGLHAFQACALDHSATHPISLKCASRCHARRTAASARIGFAVVSKKSGCKLPQCLRRAKKSACKFHIPATT